MEYFPEHMAIQCRGGYRAAFRLFLNSPIKYVRKNGEPLVFPTKDEAKSAARETLRRVLNPPIRSEQIEAPVNDALADEAAAFLARRDQEVAEERAKFGAMSTVFLKGGKTVAVEHRSAKPRLPRMVAK